jgi:hypothetical protein
LCGFRCFPCFGCWLCTQILHLGVPSIYRALFQIVLHPLHQLLIVAEYSINQRFWRAVLLVWNIEFNTGKSGRQGNLWHPRVRFQSFADETSLVSERLKSYPRVSEISLSCTFYRCLILFLTFICSCILFNSYVLLADDHVNNASYFPFMSIKKVIPHFCVLREG